MDKWSNIVDALLKDDKQRKHKNKPLELTNIAAGTYKRLQGSLHVKKQSRRTEFDNARNLSRGSSPIQLSEAEKKLQKRREQLIKWKQEKQQKKQLAAERKKKPFVVGVVHASLTFAPPPPVPRCVPSTSGRVTRSQTLAKNAAEASSTRNYQPNKNEFKSFAPKNSVFHPPKLKITHPLLETVSSKDKKNTDKSNILKMVDNFAKKVTIQKAPVNRSTVTKPNQDAKVVKPLIRSKNVKDSIINNASTNQIITRNKVNVLPKINITSKINNKATKISAQTKVNIIKTMSSNTNKPKVNEISVRNKKIEFIVEKMTPRSVRNKPKRVQTPRRPNINYRSSSEDQSDKSISSQTSENDNSFQLPQTKATSVIGKVDEGNVDLNVTPMNVIPKSESSSEERLKKQIANCSFMSPEQIREEAKRISPCVILSRGKENARRELKQKLDDGLIDEFCNVESVHHFKQQLNAEITRMTELCATWDQIAEQNILPEFVQERILSATGQARLLMSQKFQQFSGLVERCAAQEECVGGGLVVPADLQGFWDMLFIQVDNIDLKFKELERLQQRSWVEEEISENVIKKPTVNNKLKKHNRFAVSSKLRDLIVAARRAVKEPSTSLCSDSDQTGTGVVLPFSPRQSVRCSDAVSSKSATPRTPSSASNMSLSYEAQKASARKSLASYAMLRASQISKSVEIEGVSPLELTPKNLTPINLNATPARSILKSKNSNQSERKLTKTVLFNNHVDSDSDIKNDSTANNDVNLNSTYDIQPAEACAEENVKEDSKCVSPSKEKGIEGCRINATESVNQEENDNKSVTRKKYKKTPLKRQEGFEEDDASTHIIMTRRRRQSVRENFDLSKAEDQEKILKSSKKKKALQELEVNTSHNTDLDVDDENKNEIKSAKRNRRKRSHLELENVPKSTPRRSTARSKVYATKEDFNMSENIPYVTPRRSTRIRKSDAV